MCQGEQKKVGEKLDKAVLFPLDKKWGYIKFLLLALLSDCM